VGTAAEAAEALPDKRAEEELGRRRLRQLIAYARKVYALAGLLGRVEDSRRKPGTTAPLVAAAVLYTGLLRIRSFNALEPRLREKTFLRIVGVQHERMAVSVAIVQKAERNKVFREGWHGALRYVAIDGWEPFCSRHRHCSECLVRQVRVKQHDDSCAEVPEYYHRFAVAMLIDKRFDLLLDFEPLLPKDLRRITPKAAKGKTRSVVKADEDEGELTAAMRLIKRVKQSFEWIDVVVGDALYANGPFLTTAKKLGLGAVIIARREGDEPLKEALQIWGNQPPHKLVEDKDARESIELWDCPDLETLQSYEGKIRCVRGRVTKPERPEKPPSTWCMLVVGKAQRLAPEKVLAVARARWHIENTGFHQWTTRWQFDHVFTHHANGIRALFWLFFAAFNLLTLFLYCQLRSYGRDRGKDVTRTISRLVDEMLDDLVRLGDGVWDTS
jgi:hypothetical protein